MNLNPRSRPITFHHGSRLRKINAGFASLLLLATSCLYAEASRVSQFGDASKNKDLPGGYKAFAGPVWKTSGPLDLDKTPPDFYRVEITEKAGTGWRTVIEKIYQPTEVDIAKLRKTPVEQLIRYDAPTRRVGFFIKGENATFVYTLPESVLSAPEFRDTPESENVVVNKPSLNEVERAKRFIPDATFALKDGKREYNITRWTTLPRLEIVSKDAGLTSQANDLHASIFKAAGPLPPGEGKITVYAGPAKELTKLRNKLAGKVKEGSWSFWTTVNPSNEITEGTVFVITDRLTVQSARRALARGMMGVVGFPSESREEISSIQNPENGRIDLDIPDQRMITFIYKHTKPGPITREELLEKIARDWR